MPVRRRPNAFERRRQLGFGRLLLIARRDFLTRLNQLLAESGEPVFQSIQIASYLDGEGTRSIDIARRMGVSKQAVGAMVRELEAAGLVVQTPDPDDGRATLVSFTDEGLRYLRLMHVQVRKIEREYAALIGAETFAAIREGLALIAYRGERDAAPVRRRRQAAP